VWRNQETGGRYIPLEQVGGPSDWRGRFEVRDSPLSEFGVLGFEYGYSIADPRAWCCGRRSSATSPTARRSSSTSSSRRAS
jgi:2-oxoglutarate dehydrogenase complex dehydrogenase (E1) component-like enzyme